jgi:hypothetical protein
VSERTRVALILGAGWSAAAGYPLARDLLDGPTYVTSDAARRRAQGVLDAYACWTQAHRDGYPEQFLAAVERGEVKRPPTVEAPTLFDAQGGPPLPWAWAVETVMLRLSWPQPADGLPSVAVQLSARAGHRLRYHGDLALPAKSPVHRQFIRDLLAQHELAGIITTNYDTLAERVLRHRPMARTPEPGFHYAGIARPQWAYGASPWDRYGEPSYMPGRNRIAVDGHVPLCKLHGSLNWEPAGQSVRIYRDMRLPFRGAGSAAIVAPTPEKRLPSWLADIWDHAYRILSGSDRWIVVGYSLPTYDYAVRDLMRRAADGALPRSIEVHDPFAEQVAANWERATGLPAETRPGLTAPVRRGAQPAPGIAWLEDRAAARPSSAA